MDTNAHAADCSSKGHRLALDERWSVWRDVVLRSTGLSVSRIEALAQADLAEATDGLGEAELLVGAALAALRQLAYARLSSCGPEQRRYWRRVMHELQRERIRVEALYATAGRDIEAGAAPDSANQHFQTGLASLRDLLPRLEAARAHFAEAWDSAQARLVLALQHEAMQSDLAEAMTWQNPSAAAIVLDRILRATNCLEHSAGRSAASLLVNHLYRYAVKNDSIGFFGPVAWAHVGPGVLGEHGVAGNLVAVPGTGLTCHDGIDFEPWAVERLALAAGRDPRLRNSLVPRKHPSHFAQGDLLFVQQRPLRLPPLERALFEACDGCRALYVVLTTVRQWSGLSEEAVSEAFSRLERTGVVHCKLVLPFGTRPLARLRCVLQYLAEDVSYGADSEERRQAAQEWRDSLQRLQSLADGLIQARNSPSAVAQGIQALDVEFTSICGEAPRHLPGEPYAGRTLVYLDCARDVTVRMGERLLKDLTPDLRPVLDAAYWYSCQLHAQLSEFACDLIEPEGLSLDAWWQRMQAQAGMISAIADDVDDQLAERWDAFKAGQPSVFDDPASGWPGADFQSPDLMLAAASVGAIEAGDYQWVLGELHPADRGMLRQVFVDQHADPQMLIEALVEDQTEPELRPLFRNEAMLLRTRTLPDGAPHVYDIECDHLVSPLPRERVLRSGELYLQWQDGTPVIVTLDRRLSFPLRAFLGPQVTLLAMPRFRVGAVTAYAPRFARGRLVMQRESWRVPIERLTAAHDRSPQARWRKLRRVARDLGWPRMCFYRVKHEPKPLFLDLDSPLAVDAFARAVRGAGARGGTEVTVTEMLPTPDQCWLSDSDGHRYCSEFRTLFVRGRYAAATVRRPTGIA
jgi:hypothetical protein